MSNIFFPISFILFATFFLFLSKSKKNYQKIVESNGEEFAVRVNKGLKVCGYLLLICSIVWLLSDLLF
jgi:isoprenylcysteine carboxyl methyltransferase (ICMT) family protein YpbQ